MSLENLLVIAGPTASGKSRLAVEVAAALDGEIVSADAFAVYRGLDIGTDKPSAEVRERIRHHLVDVVDPRETYSAGAFAAAADEAIAEILSRHKTPIVAGGTHFYLRALLLGLFPSPPHHAEVRERLTRCWDKDPEALRRKLREVDPDSADRIGSGDRQRILRALEVWELTGEALSSHWTKHRQRPRYRPMIAVPDRARHLLYARIEARVDSMFAAGLVEEVSQILASGVPSDAHALKAIGYREVVAHLQGEFDLPTAVSQTKLSSRKLAKRQLTWLRGLEEGAVRWVPPFEESGGDRLIALWNDFEKGRE